MCDVGKPDARLTIEWTDANDSVCGRGLIARVSCDPQRLQFTCGEMLSSWASSMLPQVKHFRKWIIMSCRCEK